MLDWVQLHELEAQGVEIGAHSHSHPQLDTLPSAALRDEMVRPKELLEDALGHEVRSVAYPHGYNGPRVRRAARRAGYDSAAAVRNRLRPQGEDEFGFSRLTMLSTTTADDLSAWLEPAEGNAPLRESLRTTAGRTYRRSRALLRRKPGSVYA
jgi:peptidoglycan/xylan/chitin deacetylase (PgdA/CDA1 family)